MTVLAIQPQPLFVNIFRVVAVIAVIGCSLEFGINMAFLAGGNCMHAD